jgi:polyvinyl alcohol dehydrogenase (cytochrome)
LRHRLWASAACLVFLLLVAPPTRAAPTAAGAAGSDWTGYTHDIAGSGFNRAERTLGPSNAGSLSVAWKAAGGGGGMSAQPLSVGDVAYWGSWDGNMHATAVRGPNAGRDLWTRNLGVMHGGPRCRPRNAALTGTPAFGRIGSTPTLFVADGGNDAIGSGSVVLSALNATDGTIEWQTAVAPIATDEFAWSSPQLFGGSVYYSLASLADCPVIQGRVVKLDAATGAVQATAVTGGGVWGTPTIDAAAGRVYVPVGGPAPGNAGPFANALVELNASDLSVVASWALPAFQQLSDGDFGSVPTLFRARIGGRQRDMVGLGNKNGIFYAWDRADIGAGPLWERPVAIGGNGPQGGGGTLSPAVWDGSTLYVAGGRTIIGGSDPTGGDTGSRPGGTACPGSVRALDPATGDSRWEWCAPGHILGPLAGAPGLIAAPVGSSIVLLDAATGQQLFRYDEPGGGLFWGGPAIGNGHVFAGNMDASLTALALPATSIALAPAAQVAPAGSTRKVSATVIDGSGRPLPGTAVTFAVTSGPDAGRGAMDTTGPDGRAAFSVTGGTPGDDLVQATFTDASGATHTSSPAQLLFMPPVEEGRGT